MTQEAGPPACATQRQPSARARSNASENMEGGHPSSVLSMPRPVTSLYGNTCMSCQVRQACRDGGQLYGIACTACSDIAHVPPGPAYAATLLPKFPRSCSRRMGMTLLLGCLRLACRCRPHQAPGFTSRTACKAASGPRCFSAHMISLLVMPCRASASCSACRATGGRQAKLLWS